MSAYDGNGNQRSLLVPSTDGWDDAAKDASDRLIQGQILLFADWRYRRQGTRVGRARKAAHRPLNPALLAALGGRQDRAAHLASTRQEIAGARCARLRRSKRMGHRP